MTSFTITKNENGEYTSTLPCGAVLAGARPMPNVDHNVDDWECFVMTEHYSAAICSKPVWRVVYSENDVNETLTEFSNLVLNKGE